MLEHDALLHFKIQVHFSSAIRLYEVFVLFSTNSALLLHMKQEILLILIMTHPRGSSKK